MCVLPCRADVPGWAWCDRGRGRVWLRWSAGVGLDAGDAHIGLGRVWLMDDWSEHWLPGTHILSRKHPSRRTQQCMYSRVNCWPPRGRTILTTDGTGPNVPGSVEICVATLVLPPALSNSSHVIGSLWIKLTTRTPTVTPPPPRVHAQSRTTPARPSPTLPDPPPFSSGKMKQPSSLSQVVRRP